MFISPQRYAVIRLDACLLLYLAAVPSKSPTALIDACRVAESVSALAEVLPNADTTVLAGQGHGVLMQSPDLVAGAIAGFLARVG